MAGTNNDYVASLSKRTNIDDGLRSMLGDNKPQQELLSTSTQNVSKGSSDRILPVTSTVSLFERTDQQQCTATFTYECENRGEQAILVLLDFTGSVNVVYEEPKETQGMKCVAYVGPGEKNRVAALRQHLSTHSCSITVAPEVKTTLREYAGAADFSMFESTGPKVQKFNMGLDHSHQLSMLDTHLNSVKDSLSQGGSSLYDARIKLEEAEQLVRVLRTTPVANQLNPRVQEINSLRVQIREKEIQESGGFFGTAKIDINELLGAESGADDILRSLSQIEARAKTVNAQNVFELSKQIMDELKVVKEKIAKARQEDEYQPELSECVQKFNHLSRTLPQEFNSILSQNPQRGPAVQTVMYGQERQGFVVDPITGQKRYTTR